MAYLIDTDHVIDHMAEQPAIVTLLSRLAQDGIAISMVTYMEAFEGIVRDPNPAEARAKFDRFLAGVPVLPFSEAVAETCARLRHALRRQNKRVNSRALDLVNAGTALHYGLTFVTRNFEDYDDIPGLLLYRTNLGGDELTGAAIGRRANAPPVDETALSFFAIENST